MSAPETHREGGLGKHSENQVVRTQNAACSDAGFENAKYSSNAPASSVKT